MAQKGLGDTIKIITSALGFKQCESCKMRQVMLNNWFPYKKVLFTDEQILYIEEHRGETDKGLCNNLNIMRREIEGVFTEGCMCSLIDRKLFIDDFYKWFDENK